MKRLKDILPDNLYLYLLNIYNNLISDYASTVYSQEGEDLLLHRILDGKIDQGYYVDVGAHHPKRFSNTYFFYKRGWRGINIEPMPGSKKIFDKYRTKDINLEIPISSRDEELTYYVFNDPALNGFSKETSLHRNTLKDYKIIKTINMRTRTLSSVLNEYLPRGQKIDLLNVDVEDMDIEVLKSNDWNLYKPRFILSEDKTFDIETPDESEVYDFLFQLDYRLIAKTFNTLFFQIK
jgi:FkbM family methyltransferase